eukprot:349874-Chlamydomonas_euryale.AAC.3
MWRDLAGARGRGVEQSRGVATADCVAEVWRVPEMLQQLKDADAHPGGGAVVAPVPPLEFKGTRASP